MTEREINELKHRATRRWRISKYHRDVAALCDLALEQSKAKEELHLAKLSVKHADDALEKEQKQHAITKDGLRTAMEAVYRIKGGKDDNGRLLPTLTIR